MRETEMRQRIEGFLKRRMQSMLAPALGLGMAVTGCQKESVTPVYSAPVPDASLGPTQDAPSLIEAAPAPDTLLADAFVPLDTNLPGPDVVTGADSQPQQDLATVDGPAGTDAKPDTSGEVGPGLDAQSDLGSIGVKYIAQLPDGGPGITPLYMAPLYMALSPDAGKDGSPVLRYMAQFPDGGPGMTPLYLAQVPKA
jgi:hypothetical protein